MGSERIEGSQLWKVSVCLACVFLTAAIMTVSVFAADSGLGEKTGNMAVIYGITSLLALLLAVGCFRVVHKKEPWFLSSTVRCLW